LSLSLLLLGPERGHAAVFNCASGDVACLISAITSANSTPEADTITLAAGTYTLTVVNNTTDEANGLPSITSPIAITGAGIATIIERAPGAPLFRLFHVAATGTLQLTGLTLRNGGDGPMPPNFLPPERPQFPGNGAGIFSAGSLTLSHVVLKDNSSGEGGGGLYNIGTTVATHTTFRDNSARNLIEDGGGGLANGPGGTATITNSAIVRNHAGGASGIANKGALTLTNVTLSENSGFGYFFPLSLVFIVPVD
jgi:hypothetical protein